jgi:hypothetical protein
MKNRDFRCGEGRRVDAGDSIGPDFRAQIRKEPLKETDSPKTAGFHALAACFDGAATAPEPGGRRLVAPRGGPAANF